VGRRVDRPPGPLGGHEPLQVLEVRRVELRPQDRVPFRLLRHGANVPRPGRRAGELPGLQDERTPGTTITGIAPRVSSGDDVAPEARALESVTWERQDRWAPHQRRGTRRARKPFVRRWWPGSRPPRPPRRR